MLAMMDSGPGFTGPVNIGIPSECTILQLAELVLKLVGGPSRIVYRPLPQDDPRQRQPDIALARDRLGWAPRVALKDGLRETVADFRALLAAG